MIPVGDSRDRDEKPDRLSLRIQNSIQSAIEEFWVWSFGLFFFAIVLFIPAALVWTWFVGEIPTWIWVLYAIIVVPLGLKHMMKEAVVEALREEKEREAKERERGVDYNP